MATDGSFPGRVVFVWHAIREIRNRLPDAIAGEVERFRTEYRDLTETLAVLWVQDGWPADGGLPIAEGTEASVEGPQRFEVSQGLLGAVGNLVAGHLSIAGRNKANAQRLFEAVGGSGAPLYVVRAWLEGTRDAHKLAHGRTEPLDPEHDAALLSQFITFEATLLVLARRSYENMDDLDEILDLANR
jgi:hypothetical protein